MSTGGSKYAKFSQPLHAQAQAQAEVTQETKRRLEQLESERARKKTRLQEAEQEEEFYDDEEEEAGQHEAFYAHWQSLEERLASLNENAEHAWPALRQRITALLERRAGLAATATRGAIGALAELESEDVAFRGHAAALKQLQAQSEGRDADAEALALETRKQACFLRFSALSRAADQLLALRDALRQQLTRSLGDRELRALTRPLDLGALFACAFSDGHALYYGASGGGGDYLTLVAGARHYVMVRRDTLLL